MNQGLSSGADSIQAVSLQKTHFSKQTHGEIIMPPYSMSYSSFRLVLKGAQNSFTAISHAAYTATHKLHCSPIGMFRESGE